MTAEIVANVIARPSLNVFTGPNTDSFPPGTLEALLGESHFDREVLFTRLQARLLLTGLAVFPSSSLLWSLFLASPKAANNELLREGTFCRRLRCLDSSSGDFGVDATITGGIAGYVRSWGLFQFIECWIP
jgi:hypothetical protein